MATIYLVRHGETDANRVLLHGVDTPPHDGPVTFKYGDDTNVPLNPNGRTHAWEAAQNLPDNITRILASPLLRTRETAEIICGEKGIDAANIEIREELREFHAGRLEGVSAEQRRELMGESDAGSGMLCNYDYTKYGGDSWKTIHERLSALLDELKKEDDSVCVACVTSGGIIRMAYKILFDGRAPNISAHILIKNGSVHEFRL